MDRVVLSTYNDSAFLYVESTGDCDPEARFYLSSYDGKWEAEIWFPAFSEEQMLPTQLRTFNSWEDVLMYSKSIAIWFGINLAVEERK